jgi:hypothetical protein
MDASYCGGRTLLHLKPYVAALVLTTATAWINPPTDERALYGHEGSMEENLQPREVAGWPAPYLADSPNTSVIHQLGVEDDFRPGPFVASLSFWLLVSLGFARLMKRSARRDPKR